MNPHNPKHQPDFTAFALGEVSPAEAARMQREIESNPDSLAEYERTLEIVAALGQAPALPKRKLHPRQRDTVLAMGKKTAPLRSLPQPAKAKRPAVSTFWTIGKYAAAACLAVGAFALGRQLETPSRLPASIADNSGVNKYSAQNTAGLANSSEAQDTAETASLALLPSLPAEDSMAANFDAVAVNSMLPDLLPQLPDLLSLPVVTTDVPTGLATASSSPAVLPQAKPQNPLVLPSDSKLKSFENAPNPGGFSTADFELVSRNPETRVKLNPNLLRPKPSPSEAIFAAPAPVVRNNSTNQNKPRKQDTPALIIRSWKAEIASCPWNSNRRLLRLVAQVPVDQPAITANEESYELLAKFDPRMVQAYRLVAEKHLAPTGGNRQGTQFAWFEIIPTRSFAASQEKPVTLGSIDVVQPRGTKQARPLELKIVDRGSRWQDAREDFIFETAMVGFGLLLEGTGNTGSLNHDLVLKIAEMTRGHDPKGERSKFIEAIKQAQNAAGLDEE